LQNSAQGTIQQSLQSLEELHRYHVETVTPTVFFAEEQIDKFCCHAPCYQRYLLNMELSNCVLLVVAIDLIGY